DSGARPPPRPARPRPPNAGGGPSLEGRMSVRLEAYLARLYLDAEARRAFLDNPRAAAQGAGLGEADVSALARMDLAGLEMAAHSLSRKRAAAGAAQNVPRPPG